MSPLGSLDDNLDIPTTNTSPASTTMDRNQMINFLKEYRILECNCCSRVVGFQQKATGIMYCLVGCHERSPPPSLQMTHIPNPLNRNGGTVIPPAGPMNGSTSITVTSNGLHGTVGGVPNAIVGFKQPPIMPIAARVLPTAEAVLPISTPKVDANPPPQKKAKVQEAVPMSAKVSSSVQQRLTEKVLVTPPPPQNVPVTEKVRAAPSEPKNFPGTAEVQVAPRQPKTINTNVHIPVSMTNVIQGSLDVPDAKIREPKPAPPVVVSVKHNSNVALSRARIPWPEYGSSESLKCIVVFDCGDGGIFLQSSDPGVVESINSVGESIANFVRSGKCKSLARPAVGALCLAPFEGVHYRAEIIAEEAGGEWRTFFIDYGNTEILNTGDFLILPDDLKTEPRLCAFGYWDQVLAGQKKSDELHNIYDIEAESVPVTMLQKIADGQYIIQIGEAANATFEVEIPSTIPVPVQAQSPPQYMSNVHIPVSMINVIQGSVDVPDAGIRQMPIADGVPPNAEAVRPISSVKVVADPPQQEKVKVQEAVPMSAKVSSSVQQRIREKVLVTPPPPQNVPVTEKVRTAPSEPKNFPGTGEVQVTPSQSKNIPSTAEVQVTPRQPKTFMSNVHVPVSMTNVIQGSVDAPDAKIREQEPVPPVVVSVEHNPNVALSRADLMWPEYQSSESLKCILVFDCGDGGFFLQSSDPGAVESINSVGEIIANFVHSGKCKSLAKPAVGALCLAPFEGVHYRAEIIAEEAEGKWRTFFIDYGNTEIITDEDFFILPEELKKEPRLCAFGYWDQVLAGQKKSDELHNMYDIEADTVPVTFSQKITDGQYIIQIGEVANATFEMERPPPSIPVPVQVKAPPQWKDCTFSPNLLSPEAVVLVFHVWDAATLQVMANADQESVINFQTLIAEYVSEAAALTRSPYLGEIVVAPYNGLYYRAKVDKVEGDNCTCTFVDYGDSKVINISDIKPINDAIMKNPVYGMKVRLERVPTPHEGFIMSDRLDDLIHASGYYLDLTQKGEVKPANLPHFDARLLDLEKKFLLNNAVKAAIVAFK